MKIKIKDVEIDCAPDQSIFDAAQDNNILIPTACGGVGNCGLCRILVKDGMDYLTPFNEVEKFHMGNISHIVPLRLSCQCRFVKDGLVSIEIKE